MFDPLHKWLGIPPGEQPPHHYRLLGIAIFEDDADVIDAAADKHLAFLHDLTNGEYAEMAEQLSNQVSAARLCLLNNDKKKAYDDTLRGQLERSNPAGPPIVEPAYDVSQPPKARTTSPGLSASPPVVGRKRASTRPQTKPRRYWHYSTLICIIALVLIGIGVMQGRFTLDLSMLESLGWISSTQSAPTRSTAVDVPQPAEPPAQTTSTKQTSEPNDGASSSKPPARQPSAAKDAPVDSQPSKTKPSNKKPSKTAVKRSLGDLVHSNAGTEDASPIVKSPLPSESQLDEKRRLIGELYQDEYRSAKTSAEKIELAKLMHREGQKTTDDPIGRFALWRVARDILTLQGEFTPAMGIVDNLDSHYEGVETNRLKVETLRESVSHVPDARLSDYLDAVVSVVTVCGKAEEFDLANSLCTFVKQDVGTRAGNPQRSELEKVESEIRVREDSFKQYEKALQRLTEAKDDPYANQMVGRHLCFIRGEWEPGIKYLLLGLQPNVRSAAERETAAQSDASQAMAVADAWYGIAESESESIAQATIRRHALQWYHSAQVDAKGLERRKVDSRIAELERLFPPAPGDAGIPGSSSPSNVLGYRMKTSSESRSDFADRRGNAFTIGMGSRPDGRGEAVGGIELQGVEKLTVVGSASHNDMPSVDAYSKTGFVIDYHTPGGYAKRVFLGTGLHPGRQFTDAPAWGTAQPPEITTDIGRGTSYEIDLMRWAPSTWDGRCWFTIYMQNAGVNRALRATVSW